MAGNAKKFNLKDLLNERSKEAAVQQPEEDQTIIVEGEQTTADIYDLIPSKENFYSVEDVQDLKESMELVGILQPLLVSEPENGKRNIFAGHRRRLAALQLVEEGKERFRYVPIIVKQKKNAILDKLALIMANRFREKSDWEKMTEAVETERLVLELKEQMDIPGRTRDLLAEIINTSSAQLGRYKAIYNNLIPELMAEFKENRINVSVAYEASGLPEDYQKQAAEIFRENEVLSLPDIKKLKKAEEDARPIPGQMEFGQLQQEQQESQMAAGSTGEGEESSPAAVKEGTEEAQEDFDPAPATITSLCYSCTHYEECHEKKSTVTDCNNYINREEAYKSDEQRYNEEQDAIDRETQRKLREQAQEAKMQQLPSDGEEKQHDIRLAASKYDEITSGKLTFLLLKKDGYKVGEEFDLPEYAEGKETGRKIDIEITYVWEDWTGLDDDYCIIGFNVTAFDA